MSETKYAENVAGIVLDRSYEDPDSELSVLARQFLRSRERIAEFEKALEPFANIPPMRMSDDVRQADAMFYWCVVGSPIKQHFTSVDLTRARAVLSQGDRTASVSDGRLLETNLVQAVSETTVPLCDHPVSAHERVVARLREWFRDPANGDYEFTDFQAFMIDAGLASRHGCACFLYDPQVCDICQGIAKDPQRLKDGWKTSEA